MLTCSVVAQDFSQHEFSINVGGGVSNFRTQQNIWGLTGSAGLGYHYFLNSRWAIGTGANFAVYNGGIANNNLNQQHATENGFSGTPFDFLVSSSNYKESQRATMITIPLMAQYLGEGERAFYAAMGGKIAVPVSASSTQSGTFTTKGYYPNLNVTYQNIPNYGFVTNHPFPNNITDIKLKTAIMASAEAGVRWRLSETKTLYTGVYVDLGLNNILNETTAASVVVHQPNTPAQFVYNTAAKRVSPFATGITLRLAFGRRNVSTTLQPVPAALEVLPIVEEILNSLVAEEQQHQTEEVVNRDEETRLLEEAKIAAINKLELPLNSYELSQTEFTATQRAELEEKVALLKHYPDLQLHIYGHTCEIGSREANERVGLARAENAKRYLISQGIAENRILTIVSKRDTEPIVQNNSEENRRINRRVQLKIIF